MESETLRKDLNLYFHMIRLNNYWPEVAISYIKTNQSGLKPNRTSRNIFELYPDIKRAYDLAQDLRNIFEKTTDKVIGLSRLARWHRKVNQS
jgi:hypothetical protein